MPTSSYNLKSLIDLFEEKGSLYLVVDDFTVDRLISNLNKSITKVSRLIWSLDGSFDKAASSIARIQVNVQKDGTVLNELLSLKGLHLKAVEDLTSILKSLMIERISVHNHDFKKAKSAAFRQRILFSELYELGMDPKLDQKALSLLSKELLDLRRHFKPAYDLAKKKSLTDAQEDEFENFMRDFTDKFKTKSGREESEIICQIYDDLKFLSGLSLNLSRLCVDSGKLYESAFALKRPGIIGVFD